MKKGTVIKENYTITPSIYDGFKLLFNDLNPMHTNGEYAKENGFQDVVMHGNILNGFVSHFIGESLPIKNVVIVSQTIKYYNPVYLGDTIEFKGTVIDVFDSVNVVEFKFEFRNELKIASGKIQIKVI